jgi:hypothetical protein
MPAVLLALLLTKGMGWVADSVVISEVANGQDADRIKLPYMFRYQWV